MEFGWLISYVIGLIMGATALRNVIDSVKKVKENE